MENESKSRKRSEEPERSLSGQTSISSEQVADEALFGAERGIKPEVVRSLKQLAIDSLPVAQRLAMEDQNRRVEAAREAHQLARVNQEQAAVQLTLLIESGQIPHDVREQLIQARTKLEIALQEDAKAFPVLEQVVQERRDLVLQSSRETWIDSRTGLQTRSIFMRDHQEIVNFLDGSDLEGVGNVVYMAIDLMNFKVGNDLYGEHGMDKFLREHLAVQMMALSVASGVKDYQSQVVAQEASNELFGIAGATSSEEQSQRQKMLSELQRMGVQISFFRDKTGGDEMILRYNFTKGYLPEGEQIADGLVDEVMRMGRFSKHNPEVLLDIRNTAEQLWKDLDPGWVQESDKVAYTHLKLFADFLTTYATESGIFAPVTDDPECRLTWRFSSVRSSFAEAAGAFLYGVDTQGNPVTDDEGQPVRAFYRQDTQGNYTVKNEDRWSAYANDLRARVDTQIVTLATMSEEEVYRLGRDIMAMDILGSSLQRSMGLKLERAKAADKADLIVQAFSGDAQAAYQVGALRREGRLGSDVMMVFWRPILERLSQIFEARYMDEVTKPPDERDQFLIDSYNELLNNRDHPVEGNQVA